MPAAVQTSRIFHQLLFSFVTAYQVRQSLCSLPPGRGSVQLENTAGVLGRNHHNHKTFAHPLFWSQGNNLCCLHLVWNLSLIQELAIYGPWGRSGLPSPDTISILVTGPFSGLSVAGGFWEIQWWSGCIHSGSNWALGRSSGGGRVRSAGPNQMEPCYLFEKVAEPCSNSLLQQFDKRVNDPYILLTRV